jgi:hypothetical protein
MDSAFPADIVDLQVTEHGPDARVITVTSEVDTVTAPELAACLTAQLAAVQAVVVNLDGMRCPDQLRLTGAAVHGGSSCGLAALDACWDQRHPVTELGSVWAAVGLERRVPMARP